MAEKYNRNDLNAVLSRIETKIENKGIVDAERWQRMEVWMELHVKEATARDKRIGALENWRWYVLGIALGAGLVVKLIWK